VEDLGSATVATIEQETEERNRLNAQLSELAKIQADQLKREDVLGSALSFSDGIAYFQRTLRLLRDLSESNLDSLPFVSLQQLNAHAQQALERFGRVQKFSLTEYPSNPKDVRDAFINENS